MAFHKCGHDGHGYFMWFSNRVISTQAGNRRKFYYSNLLKKMVAVRKSVFRHKICCISTRLCFALHNLPGYPKNQIIVKNDTFTCAVNSIIIKLEGIAHAGEPEKDQSWR
jgi:metal-dependent amidase/aminoacylase/carboxypeptidase family protein